MTENEFNNLICDIRRNDFTFLIGGGASLSSNVKSPYELAYSWFEKLFDYMIRIQIAETNENSWVKPLLLNRDTWKYSDTPNCIGKQRPISEYLSESQVALTLTKRNDDDWLRLMSFVIDGIDRSYYKIATMLEDLMPNNQGRNIINQLSAHISDRAEPHYGYKYLAYFLSRMSVGDGRHDAVITTNFDNMLSVAFSTLRSSHTDMRTASTIPILITMGDDEWQLDRFNTWIMNPEQPLIFHVHNSQHFNPRNTARDVGHYPQKTDDALYKLLDNRCLLVMGYSGSDEGLMSVIKNSNCQRVYWLSYSGDEPQNAPFRRLKQKLVGNLKLLTCPDPRTIDGCPEDCPKGFDSFVWKIVAELCPEFSQNYSFNNHDMRPKENIQQIIAHAELSAQTIINNTSAPAKQSFILNTYDDKHW